MLARKESMPLVNGLDDKSLCCEVRDEAAAGPSAPARLQHGSSLCGCQAASQTVSCEDVCLQVNMVCKDISCGLEGFPVRDARPHACTF